MRYASTARFTKSTAPHTLLWCPRAQHRLFTAHVDDVQLFARDMCSAAGITAVTGVHPEAASAETDGQATMQSTSGGINEKSAGLGMMNALMNMSEGNESAAVEADTGHRSVKHRGHRRVALFLPC